jgi:hypothetical protein
MNIALKPTHVAIIGNGFDLSLGFKTSYGDFLKSNEFKELLSLDNFIAIHLHKVHAIQNWIDAENELSKLSRSVGLTREDFKGKYVELTDSLKTYLKKIDTKKFDQSSRAALLVKELIDEGGFHVFNFNYTDSFQKILNASGRSSQGVVTHVHGSLDEDEIIFGIQDKSDAHPEHAFLNKSSSRLFNGNRNDPYKKLLGARKITFFGHSLGPTDHHYFQEFFSLSANRLSNQSFHNKEFNFYFHDDRARDSIYAQLNVLTQKKVDVLKVKNTFNESTLSN